MGLRLRQWCDGGTELVRILCDAFGEENVLIRSAYHVQIRQQSLLHNVWIDSSNTVKYRLADQAGRAQVASTAEQLRQAIGGHDQRQSDLSKMRRALELSELINKAKAALPLSGLAQAVFVDAGSKADRAQIGVVEVTMKVDGEHVRAESHPCAVVGSEAAETAAIAFALGWSGPNTIIFCDNQSAVQRARKRHGDRIRWLPRSQNRAADRVANLRSKKNRRPANRKRGPNKKAP